MLEDAAGKGIREIGWHCVDSNTGSYKLNVQKAINSLKRLIDTGWSCKVQYLCQYDTFLRFKDDTQWIEFIDYLNNK